MTNTSPAVGDRTANTLLIAAAVALGLVVLVWAGAAVACALTGTPVRDLADGGDALARLPAHLADPAHAWRPPLVVGRVVYWAAQAVVLAGVATLGWLGLRTITARGQASRGGFGRPSQLHTLTIGRPRSGRVSLGYAGRHLLAAEPGASLAVIGPTGCGKTAGLAIPALLEWDGPILATSVKTDLLDATLAHRQRAGRVWVYDPTTATATEGAGWSPLDHCGTWADAQRTAAWLCDAAQPKHGSLADADYWYTQARKALAPHLYAAARHGRTVGDVVAWVETQDDADLYDLLERDQHAEPAALRSLQGLWAKEERLRSSIYATAEAVLLAYADPGVQAAAALASRVDLDAWLSGNNTIYLVAPSHEQARLRPVFTVAAQAAIRAAYTTANQRGGQLERPCLALLDEAGNTASLPDLPAYAATGRSHGITLITVWQDLAQLKDRYGDQAATVLNNHRARLFGRGIADQATLDYLTRLIGEVPRRDVQRSTDLGGGRRTVSDHLSYRPAAPADLLRRLRADHAVLLYGAEAPAQIRLRSWYADRTLRRLTAVEESGDLGRSASPVLSRRRR